MTESEYSELPTDDNEEEDDEEEATLYFDAEEGRLAMPDGTTLEVVDDEEVEEEDAVQEEGREGGRTPRGAESTATGQQRDPQTITSTSLTAAQRESEGQAAYAARTRLLSVE